MDGVQDKVAFIWSVADLLRGDYKQSEYRRVILPLTVIRRLDCVLEPTKDAVLAKAPTATGALGDAMLYKITGTRVYNRSPLTMEKLRDDPANVAGNLLMYVAGFNESVHDVLVSRFKLDEHITRLDEAGLLYQVVSKFCTIDLHPDVVPNIQMGYVFEELIRRFSEQSNETAGEHFTPREVIRLMVNLLFAEDDKLLTVPGRTATLYDCACGTGGMLSVAEDHLRDLNPKARLEVFGQELNDETYAVCVSDMLLKGRDASHIHPRNSFTHDGLAGERFDYMLANPPFGVEWKKIEKEVRAEHDERGMSGRFGAGQPRINDGSFLFLQHLISKMKPVEQGGSRIAIVFNGSPLFTGAAGSGESNIRRWIIESDWLEAVVALPDQLFYNTGISTYFWIVTNRKRPERRGKVQLIDARACWTKMRRSLGEKRKMLSNEQIDEVTRLYANFDQNERSKIFPNEAFGFRRITVERPQRDEAGENRYEVQLGKMLDQTAMTGVSTAPYLRNTNVQWDRLELNDLREMDFSDEDRQKYALRSGDLLVCEGGDVGRAAQWDGQLDPCFYQKALHRVRPMFDDEPRFLMYCLRATASYGTLLAEGNQSTIAHLTAEKLRAHRFPFPAPSEQRRIVATLDTALSKLATLAGLLDHQLTLLAEHREALITAAVTGQIDLTREAPAPPEEALAPA